MFIIICGIYCHFKQENYKADLVLKLLIHDSIVYIIFSVTRNPTTASITTHKHNVFDKRFSELAYTHKNNTCNQLFFF